LSGIASVGSLAIALGLPVVTAIIGAPWWEVTSLALIAALVMARHTSNIKRLLSGSELSASRSR
ncbi:MAG: glycerol-3-phosphate acyltransferase, partial [Ilumatobacteraceae bacterium]